MKSILYLTLSLVLVISCNKDNANNNEEALIGKWQVIEYCENTGAGDWTCRDIENGSIVDFNKNGIFTYNEGNNMDDFTSIIPGRTMVSLNGNEFWSPNRHYFINISNHSTPSGFLVHASLDNHLIDLGSWYNDRFILAYTDTPNLVPVPAAVWLFGSGLFGLIGVARRKKA